ncbi:MAG: hypothetical protein GY757_04640, partial [bacterium]|nr:hypothetical protein [bacterium]
MIRKLLHHVGKDFKYLKALPAFWLALLIIPVLTAELLGVNWEISRMNIQVSELLKGLLLFIWIPLLIQADAVVNTPVFWKTRPVSRLEVFSSKLLYIFLFIVLPALVCNSIYLGLKGFIAADIFSSGLKVIVDLIVLIIPLWMLAALTADVKRYALVATAILFSGILLNWTI